MLTNKQIRRIWHLPLGSRTYASLLALMSLQSYQITSSVHPRVTTSQGPYEAMTLAVFTLDHSHHNSQSRH